MSRSGRETPPRMSLSSGRSYQMSGSGKEACQVSGSGQEALPDVWNGLGGSPECPGVVGSPSQMSWSS